MYLREQWLSACLVFDDQAANRTLDQAFASCCPRNDLIRSLTEGAGTGLESIGIPDPSLFSRNTLQPAIAIRRVNALMAATATPTRSGHILAACPPGEEHDFVLLMISYLLRRRGWDVVYLGSNVPLIDLDTTIRSTSPILIISSAQTLKTAASLRNLSEYIGTQGVPLAYGGGIFNQIPAATQYISGYFLGTNVANVPQEVERLMTTPPPMHYCATSSSRIHPDIDKIPAK